MHSNLTLSQSISPTQLIQSLALRTANISGFFVGFEMLTTFILSFLWAIYIILKLMKISKLLKLETFTLSLDRKMAENKTIKYRNKYLLLLAICTSEYIFLFCIIIECFLRFNNRVKPEFSVFAEFPSFDHTTADSFFLFRLINSVFLTSFLSMLILIRITTQYLQSQYDYFEGYFRLKNNLIYFCSIVAVIFGLGIINVFTIVIQSILYPILLMFEYVVYIKTSIKLKQCLYKRYFDSQHHEYREKCVRSYYRRAHISFKLTFTTVAIGIFFRIIIFSITSIAPQIYVLKFLFPKVPNEEESIFQTTECLAIIRNVSVIVSSVFLFTPYILFSLGYLYTQIRKWYQFRRNLFYSNPSLIRNLIEHQNLAYCRTNFRY